MKTIRLSEADYQTLILTLGYATAACMKEGGAFETEMKAVTDWILIQGDSKNYTYWHDKETLKTNKLAELNDEREYHANSEYARSLEKKEEDDGN